MRVPLALAVLALLPILRAADPAPPRFTPEVEAIVKAYKPGGQDFGGTVTVPPPAEALAKLAPAEGYAVELVASEPVVRQPIDLKFDERGRLWVVQYLQYPFPAGLTVTDYDQYIRARFDRLPPAPPHHARGADRITILEDRDGDGKFETHRTFLDGLNLATSVLPGDGGVWVMMAPYLLFYPDRDGDDVPDGDPEVHLSGFGLEDTHSLASNLHWGPDGWIYGANGSTTTLDVQGIRLQGQGIWRYHPGSRVFEVFAEGGGNTFSLEFDRYGRAFSGTNNGGTRGLHYVQGATYVKNWPKHGPALSPFVFGFFEHMAHQGYTPRFPQTFLIYDAPEMPALRDRIVVGMSLTNRVQESEVLPDTSTFRTVDRTALVTTEDKTFRPVDIELGPDGAIYLADWTDARLSHLNPKDTWDKSNGRIYRLVPPGGSRTRIRDLRTLPTAELLPLLAGPNRDVREHARRLLAARPDTPVPALRAALERNGDDALEAFWVLNLRRELGERDLRTALHHPNEHVRRWAVRLVGDARNAPPLTQVALVQLARTESAVEVRSQLAASAKRLPAGQAVPIVRALLAHDIDAADKHLPLLLWWALENTVDTGRDDVLALVRDPAVWRTKMFSTHLAERLAQRITADQGPRKYFTLKQGTYSEWIIERAPEHLARNLAFAARLLEAAPDAAATTRLINGFARGLTGAVVDEVPPALRRAVDRLWDAGSPSSALVAFAARLGHPEAVPVALAAAKTGKLKESDLQTYLDLFAALAPAEALPLLGDLLRTEKNEARRAKRLAALGGYAAAAGAEPIFAAYATLGPRLQATAQRMLCERPAWARVLLERMVAGAFDPGVLSSANLALLRSHRDARLDSLLVSYHQKHSDDPAQQAAQQLFEAGRTAYNLTCAACHQETGDGRQGLAPGLVGSRWLQAGDEVLARIVLHGKENPGRGLVMPPWRQFDDQQLAATLTFIRREFGNQAKPVPPAVVAAVRATTASRTKPWTDAELDALAPPAKKK